MYESEIQSAVSEAIIDGEVDSIEVAVNDNELVVLVNTGQRDAAYTADEARELADSLKCVSDQRWEGDNDQLVEYIRDLAAVVDSDKAAEEVAEKWENRELDTGL